MHYGSPQILNLMTPFCTEVPQQHQLALLQWSISDMLVMVVLSTLCCNPEPLSGTLKGNLQASLVLLDPLINITTNWILDLTQQEINWEPGLLPEQ